MTSTMSENKAEMLSQLKKRRYTGEIAISGVSGRLPNCSNIGEFREKILKNVDLIEGGGRYDHELYGCPRGGHIADWHLLDASFFGVSHKQEVLHDPLVRKALETSYEALCDAGLSLDAVNGTRTGVFSATSPFESIFTGLAKEEYHDIYLFFGSAINMLPNRVSFAMNLKGPSYVTDSACSSGLVALKSAVESIRRGDCDAAFVLGTAEMLNLTCTRLLLDAGMVSGACRSFDADANGYCRSESAVAFFIQKVPDCKRIYSTIEHIKANTDGYKDNGITFPSGPDQERLMREVCEEADVNPAEIIYVEAHGTGTKAGDPQEANAICNVYGNGRKEPLLIGSVKSVVGHTENASATTSLANLIVAMEEGVIPANLHFKSPNPEIEGLLDGRLKVVTENTPWKGGLVALNSCGFGGANAHAILRSNQEPPREPHIASKKPRLFTCGARTQDGVRAVLDEAHKYADSVEFQALIQESANADKRVWPYRGYAVLNAERKTNEVQKCGADSPPLWLIIPGMGGQWHGMGRKMMELNIFKESILRSSETLRKYNINLYDLIMNGPDGTFDDIIFTFVGIAGIQVALIDLIFSMDIKPDGLIGHSMGEGACAYADGCLTAEKTILLAYLMGKSIAETDLPDGKMFAVGLTWEECLKRCPKDVFPACHNSKTNVTISGLKEPITKFAEELTNEGVFVREMKATKAYHSPIMNSVMPYLTKVPEKIIKPKRRSQNWISTSIPEERWDEDWAKYNSADYCANNLVSPVYFYEALQKVPKNAVFLEIGPHCLMQSILKQELGPERVITATMKRNHENNIEYFFSNLGKCYANGINLSPLKAYPPVQMPVPRGTPMVSPCISKIWDHSMTYFLPTPEDFTAGGNNSSGLSFDIDIAEGGADNYVNGHAVNGRVLFPATGYIVLAWKALAKIKKRIFDQMPVVIEQLTLERSTTFQDKPVTLNVTIFSGSGKFEIVEGNTLVASGIIYTPEGKFLERDLYPDAKHLMKDEEIHNFPLTRQEIYRDFRLKGYEYSGEFQGITKASQDAEVSEIKWTGHWIPFLDCVIQTKLLAYRGHNTGLPTSIEYIKIDPRIHPQASTDGNPETIVRCYSSTALDLRMCGGVEVKNVKAIPTAMHRTDRELHHTERPFVSYLHDKGTNPHSLDQYLRDCFNFTLDNLARFISHGNGCSLPNKEMLEYIMKNNKSSGKSGLEKYLTQRNCGLAQTLTKVFNFQATKNLSVDVANVLEESQSELDSDRLLGALHAHRILMPGMTMVTDNLPDKEINVFEAGAAHGTMYRYVAPILRSFFAPILTVNYTAADKSPLQKDVKNMGIKSLNSEFGPNNASQKFELLVLKNVLHKQNNIDEALTKYSKLLAPGGFIHIEEITKNFPLFLALEAMEETTPIVKPSDRDRVCQRFLTEDSWLEVFSRHGFELVYKRSDDIHATTFILRKTFQSSVPPAMVFIDDLQFSWLDDLKMELKKISNGPKDSRLWLVSKGINGVYGMGKALCKEGFKGKVKIAVISNLNSSSAVPDVSVNSVEFQKLSKKDLTYNIYRDGSWGDYPALDIEPAQEKECDYAIADVARIGDLGSVKWFEHLPLKYLPPYPDCILVQVHYTTINPKDLYIANGRVTQNDPIKDLNCCLCAEFSGTDPSGNRIMGFSFDSQGLATSTYIHKDGIMYVPDDWSLEDAATVPAVYGTAYYAFVVRGKMRGGESVLIHYGTGGVGQAAIRVAKSYGCEIFTTCANDKRQYLKKLFPFLQDDHISDSSNRNFEYDVLKATNGEGVDMVLGMYRGERGEASLRLVKKHGKYLDLMKSTQGESLDATFTDNNIAYHGVMFDYTSTHPLEVGLNYLTDGIASGVVKPLERQVFNKYQLEAAFRTVAKRDKPTKILVKTRDNEEGKAGKPSKTTILAKPKFGCDPSKSYIIVGGLGGFGLELAKWHTKRGARKLILASRSGITTGYQLRVVTDIRNQGATVVTSKIDVKTLEGVKALVKEATRLGPVGGVFNLGMVLCDGLLVNQTKEKFQQVCESKIQGTMNLDKVTREQCKDTLEVFVVFSSMSASRGKGGQSSYAFGNAVAESICVKRVHDGYHGLAVQWGGVGDVGYVVEKFGSDAVVEDTYPQRMSSCLQVLDGFLSQKSPVVSSCVPVQRQDNSTQLADVTVVASIAKILVEMDIDVIVVASIAKILGINDSSAVDPNLTLSDLGIDSLMSMEVQQLLDRQFKVSYETEQIRSLTFNALKKMEKNEDVQAELPASRPTTETQINGHAKQ